MIRHLLEFDVLEEEVRSQIEQVDDYEEKRHEWNKQLLIDDRSVEEKTTLIEELFETNTWTTMQDEWNFDKQDNLPLYDCFSSIARCWTEKTVWWHVPYVYMSYTHTHTPGHNTWFACSFHLKSMSEWYDESACSWKLNEQMYCLRVKWKGRLNK